MKAPPKLPICRLHRTPKEECAERVIAAFAAAPGAGTVRLDGEIIDIPHLKQAQALLALAASARPR